MSKTETQLLALRARATKLGIEFAPTATVEELSALIKDAKASAPEAEPATPAVVEQKAAAAKPKKAAQTSFDVLNAGGAVVRTYTVEIHGEAAEDNAKEYAKNIGGSVA